MVSYQKTNVFEKTLALVKFRIHFSKAFKPFVVFKGTTELKVTPKESLSMVSKELERRLSPVTFCQVQLSTTVAAGRSISGIMANLTPLESWLHTYYLYGYLRFRML